jgi:hypothetical protein
VKPVGRTRPRLAQLTAVGAEQPQVPRQRIVGERREPLTLAQRDPCDRQGAFSSLLARVVCRLRSRSVWLGGTSKTRCPCVSSSTEKA